MPNQVNSLLDELHALSCSLKTLSLSNTLLNSPEFDDFKQEVEEMAGQLQAMQAALAVRAMKLSH